MFVLVMSPFYLIGISLNERGTASVRSEISQTMTSRLQYYANQMELEFEKIIRFQNEFVNDDDLIELSGKSEIMTDPEKTFAMLRLQKRLLQLKYSSSYIQDAVAYIPSLAYVISANKLYDRLPEEQFHALRQLKSKSTSPFVYWKGQLFIVLPNPGWSNLDRKPPVYLLAVELSVPLLEGSLSALSVNGTGGGILSQEESEWSFASDPDHAEQATSVMARKQLETLSGHPVYWQNESYRVYGEKLGRYDMNVFMYVREREITGKLERYHAWYWGLSALTVVAILIFAGWTNRMIRQPIRKLVRAFRKLETGDLSIVAVHGSRDEFHYLYHQFNRTVSRLNVLIEEVYEHKYRMQLSELRQLQSQINPHFLYNSFFNIQAMARIGDVDGIGQYTRFLGEYFQYVTRSGQTEVPLKDEVRHVSIYASIQKMRFRDRIECSIEEIPASFADAAVPRLILQPLVENAFKYGLEHKKQGGLLEIRFLPEGSDLTITVEDNGDRAADELLERLNMLMKASAADTETTGLINVHRRLKIRYGGSAGLRFERGALGGLKIVMSLPLQPKE
ncbi:sensor histidine kinase [Cohnella zeiphila]|uniref:Histidine kinase n=1 Tax=Cohnella zeiphila TaxID=2761120 RepID=A0A7X0SIX6_9BACL|nr:histidine kinase [Cohnella zeiphila]MBB6730802.1 histidine kinase [Cohnella zeiphila]